MNQILADEKLRLLFSENCKKASTKYNWEEEKLILLKVYNSLLKEKELLLEV